MFCNICFTIRFKRKQLISPTHSHMANVNKCQNAKLHVSLTLWNKTWLTHIMSVIIIKTRFHLRVYPTKTPKRLFFHFLSSATSCVKYRRMCRKAIGFVGYFRVCVEALNTYTSGLGVISKHRATNRLATNQIRKNRAFLFDCRDIN